MILTSYQLDRYFLASSHGCFNEYVKLAHIKRMPCYLFKNEDVFDVCACVCVDVHMCMSECGLEVRERD